MPIGTRSSTYESDDVPCASRARNARAIFQILRLRRKNAAPESFPMHEQACAHASLAALLATARVSPGCWHIDCILRPASTRARHRTHKEATSARGFRPKGEHDGE